MDVIISSEGYRINSKLLPEDKKRDLERSKHIIRKEMRNLAGRRKLGYIWQIMDPLATTLVYFLVLAVFRTNVNAESMIIGITMFKIFTSSIKSGILAMKDFTGGIKSERIRTSVIIRAKLGFRIIDNFLQCSGAGIVMIIGFSASWDEMIVFLVISQILGLISEGFGLSICIFVKRIPDLGNIINYILLLMFFASPVLYPLNMAEGLHLEINKYNPFVYFVESMREYSNLGSMIFEIDVRITATILFLISVISVYGYKNMDNIRWEVSTWS